MANNQTPKNRRKPEIILFIFVTATMGMVIIEMVANIITHLSNY
jgi:hypothetical protein